MPTLRPSLVAPCVLAITFFELFQGCRKPDEARVAETPKPAGEPFPVPLATPTEEKQSDPAQPPPVPAELDTVTETIDLAGDAKAAEANVSQARQVQITRKRDGTEVERTFLDAAGNGIRTIRKTEDGPLEITRTFDGSGKILREQTYLNGVLKSENKSQPE